MTTDTNEDLLVDVRHKLEEVDAMLHQAANAGEEQAHALRARAQAALRASRARLQQMRSSAVDRSRTAARATNDWIHVHPWTAISVATAVGVLVGMLSARR